MHHVRRPIHIRGSIALESIAVVTLLLVVGLTSYLREDIWFWDDSTYMARGILPMQYGPPTWVDSPLYSGMYGLLGLAQPDPLSLYLLGRALSAVFFVACVWLSARLVSDRWLAWTVAAVASMLPVTYIWPGVSAPASGLLVIAVVLAFRFPSPAGLAGTAALTWIAAGSRPEFTWIGVAISLTALGWWVGTAIRRSSTWRSGLLTAVLAVAPPLVLALRYTTMFQRSAREWTAFSQHFALRNAAEGQDSWKSAGEIAATVFPGADSIVGAALVNASAFIEHVGRNAAQLPVTLVGHSLAIEPPALFEPSLAKAGAFALVVGIVIAGWINRGSLRSMLREGIARCIRMPLVLPVLALGAILAGSAISMLVIYPRPHYLLLPIGMALVGLSAWLTRLPQRRWQGIAPVGVIAVIWSSFAVLTLIGLPGRVTTAPPYEAALRAVQGLGQAKGVVSGDWPVALFLPGSTGVEVPPPSATSMLEALDQAHVDVVQVSPLLAQGPWSALPGFESFYLDPASLGFRPVIPDSPIWVR